MSIRKRDKDFHKAFKEVPQDEVLLRGWLPAGGLLLLSS